MDKKKTRKLIEGIIDESHFMGGVYAVSMVEHPAIESELIKLSASEPVQLKTVDDEKRLLMGAVLIPNKPIPRQDENGDTFDLYFSKPTVRRAMELFFIGGHQSDTTFEHEHPIKGLTMVESWVVENADMDKSKHHGLTVPVGTWMGSFKVEDEKMWAALKDSDVKGFSIEGMFIPKPTALKSIEMTDDEKLSKIKSLLNIE